MKGVIKIEELKKFISEYLEILDDEMPEEYWETPRNHAKDILEDFLSWLRKKDEEN